MRISPLFLFLLCAPAFADMGRDVNHDFHRGGGDREHGNERSERPGNFAPGRLSYGGNGCPAGTMQVVFAPDNLSFTMLFDQFVADTSAQGGMSCDAALPISIPAGQQMEITSVDYRGFASLPAGGGGILQSQFAFDGGGRQEGEDHDRVNMRYTFSGPLTENYEISTGVMRGGARTEMSPCGGQALLRVRNTVQVRAPAGQQAQITVDSIDGRGKSIYYVSWHSCDPNQRGHDQGRPARGDGHGRGEDH